MSKFKKGNAYSHDKHHDKHGKGHGKGHDCDDDDNSPPVAVDDHVDIDYRTGIVIQVLENDTDPDGDPLQISAVGDPEHGTTDINYNNDGTGGSLTYYADRDFFGNDEFTYDVSDGQGGVTTGEVTVTVGDPPVQVPPIASSDSADTYMNQPVLIHIMGNDYDTNPDWITLVSVTNPDVGTVSDYNLGVFSTATYTPPEGYVGPATFSYEITDGEGNFASADVFVDVRPDPLIA